jgi:hypothetical protein
MNLLESCDLQMAAVADYFNALASNMDRVPAALPSPAGPHTAQKEKVSA